MLVGFAQTNAFQVMLRVICIEVLLLGGSKTCDAPLAWIGVNDIG